VRLINLHEYQPFDILLTECRVAQVRLIFRLKFTGGKHPLHHVPLVYLQWFSHFEEEPEEPIKMFVVDRPKSTKTGRRSNVVPLNFIHRFIQLIPQFAGTSSRLTAENSAEKCDYFYVNSFADKEIYRALSSVPII
jgi:hypothetical protein